MSKYDGGPAFPQFGETKFIGNKVFYAPPGGMSLRDWFAGMALLGLKANPNLIHSDLSHSMLAYDEADAMLREREK